MANVSTERQRGEDFLDVVVYIIGGKTMESELRELTVYRGGGTEQLGQDPVTGHRTCSPPSPVTVWDLL